jgi:hypothetical protein
MPIWQLLGVAFGEKVGDDRAIFERLLDDGVRLLARVRERDGRPICCEITATFPDGARDFGREIAITELEQAINDSDRLAFRDARTGELKSPFVFSEIPVGVPVIGSRGRNSEWTEQRLAELIRDLGLDNITHWHLERNSIRQRANQAVRLGIAEVVDQGPPKTWALTSHGHALLNGPRQSLTN